MRSLGFLILFEVDYCNVEFFLNPILYPAHVPSGTGAVT